MAESVIILARNLPAVDGSVQRAAYAFLDKLGKDDSRPGLHVEPIRNAVDKRVRTGRVNDNFRAVLFKLRVEGQGTAYVYCGAWPHDEGTERARTSVLTISPFTGVPEVISAGEPGVPAATVPQVAPAADVAPPEGPTMLGHTAAELVEGLGLGEAIAARCALETREDALMDLLGEAIADGRLKRWQGDALLELATGTSMTTIRDTFQVGPVTDDTDATLVAALRDNPATSAEFTWLEPGSSFSSALKAALDEDSFESWRIWPHPSQKRMITARYGGPARISGGAGTGKTIVLLHRTDRLHRSNPDARILLTTFTTNIAAELGVLLKRLNGDIPLVDALGAPGVRVGGIDALVSSVLKAAGDDIAADVKAVLGYELTQVQRRASAVHQLWQQAIDTAGANLSPQHRRPAFLNAEYTLVILPEAMTEESDYLRARRPGRGVRLSRPQRSAVWKVVQAYRKAASVEQHLDFAEAAMVAATHLNRVAAEGGGRLYDHVVVDEGQDLGPTHLRFLRALAAKGDNDIYIAEDSHQRIYGPKIVFGKHGLQIVGRSRRLTLNYRTTAENLRLGRAILDSDDALWTDAEGETESTAQYRSLRSGPRPRLVECESLTHQYDQAAEVLRGWLEGCQEGSDQHTLAVLVRSAATRDKLVAALAERGVTLQAVDRGTIQSGKPVVMTMHRSKGAEFKRVLLFGVSAAAIPRDLSDYDYDPDEAADARRRERSLLYVAATRARDELVVTWDGDRSTFLPEPD